MRMGGGAQGAYSNRVCQIGLGLVSNLNVTYVLVCRSRLHSVDMRHAYKPTTCCVQMISLYETIYKVDYNIILSFLLSCEKGH